MNIAQLLLSRKLLTSTQVDEAHALHTAEGLRLDRAIIQLGFLSEQSMLELMSEQHHLPLVKLVDVTIPPQTHRALLSPDCLSQADDPHRAGEWHAPRRHQ